MFYNSIKPDYAQTAPGHIRKARYYYFQTQVDPHAELSVIFGGFEQCASDFEVRRNSYPWYVLEYAVKGFCQLTVNGRPLLLRRGTIAGFTPWDSHHYRCDFQSPMEHHFVVFTGSLAQSLFARSRISEGISLSPQSEEKTESLLNTLLDRGLKGGPHAQSLCACYLKTLLLELAAEAQEEDRRISRAQETYHLCRTCIEENYSRMMLPSEAAQACRINVRYMSRLFKRYHDCTPQEYLMRLKLNKAAILLFSGGQSIQEIARQVGFDDPYHFSRSFKKLYGRSPSQYRKLLGS